MRELVGTSKAADWNRFETNCCCADPLPRRAVQRFPGGHRILVGENRFPFGMVSLDGVALEDAPVQVNFYYLGQESKELRVQARIPMVRTEGTDMHELSVAQALGQGKPFVVVFATPLFCVTRMCGPVTDIAAALHEGYRDQVNFIHIEPWDLTVARAEGRLVPIQIALDWNLPTEPWVFVVDQEGRIANRFEGLVTSGELEKAITALIQ